MELLKSIVGSTLRHLLTGVGAYLIGHNWISEADWGMLLTGLIMLVSSYLWALWQKWNTVPPTTTA